MRLNHHLCPPPSGSQAVWPPGVAGCSCLTARRVISPAMPPIMPRLTLRQAAVIAIATLATARAAQAAGELYVSTEDGGEIAVVDPDRGEVVARIPVGKRPRGVKLSRDGKQLYVALSGSPRSGPGVDESKLPPADRAADGVGVVDLGTRKLVRTIPSGQDPESFDISKDGKRLFVSNEETAEMSEVDLASGRVTRDSRGCPPATTAVVFNYRQSFRSRVNPLPSAA